MSVVFEFNASINDFIPDSPILLPVDLMITEKSVLLMDVIHVLFLLSSPLRSNSVSVVFDFNASHNDVVVPVPQLLLPFDLLKMEEWIVDGYHLYVVSFVFTA